jgi:hypothetical protein
VLVVHLQTAIAFIVEFQDSFEPAVGGGRLQIDESFVFCIKGQSRPPALSIPCPVDRKPLCFGYPPAERWLSRSKTQAQPR